MRKFTLFLQTLGTAPRHFVCSDSGWIHRFVL